MSHDSRRTLIAKIHIAKKDLCLDDATYRDVLVRVTGKDSCKKMSLAELKKVVMDMKRLGFAPKQTDRAKQEYGRKPTTTPERQPMLDKIEAILADKGLHWSYAHALAQKMFGKTLITWLTADEMYKVVQVLAVYQERQNKHKG